MSNPTVTFNTTMGTITAEIFLDKVPVTASNFLDLASSGFYNGIHFHRVIPDFMAQFGCPYAKDPRSQRAGTGGPKPGTQYRNLLTGEVITRGDDGQGGGTIRDEFTARISNERGTLSMANTGSPDTGGSQFFMNVVHNESLDWFDDRTESRHPVFGMITRGMEIVDAITRVPTTSDAPMTPIQMISVSIQQPMAPAAPAAQPVVRQRVGDWAICDSPEGVLYHHVPTGQNFDQPPPQLAQFVAAQQAQEQQRLQQQQQQQQIQMQMAQQQQVQQQQQLQQQQQMQQQLQMQQMQQQQFMPQMQQQQPQYKLQQPPMQQQPQFIMQQPVMQQQIQPPAVMMQQVQPPTMAPQAGYSQQVYAQPGQQSAVYGQPGAPYSQQMPVQFYQQPVRQY